MVNLKLCLPELLDLTRVFSPGKGFVGNSTPKWTKFKTWSGSISCIDFFDWLILFWISTSWKGLWTSLYIYDDCHPTSEIMQLTVNNTCGTSWSNFGQKHQFLVMCVHSEQENYSTKWYSLLLMMNAWLILYLVKEVWDIGAQTLCPSVTVLPLRNINELVLLWKYQY